MAVSQAEISSLQGQIANLAQRLSRAEAKIAALQGQLAGVKKG